MVNFKSFSLLVSLILLASCAPLDQIQTAQTQTALIKSEGSQIEKAQETIVDNTTEAEISTPDNQTILDNQTAPDTQIAVDNDALLADEIAVDNQTAAIEIDLSQAKEETAPDIQTTSDNQTTLDNQTAAIAAPEMDIEKETEIAAETGLEAEDNATSTSLAQSAPKPVKIIPAPKPIEPLNPIIFTGLTTQNLERRLGRPDRQFNEQALDVWHYEEPHCHALFFIHNRGDSDEIMYVDLRSAILQTALNRQVCFADFGQRAEALLDKDKR